MFLAWIVNKNIIKSYFNLKSVKNLYQLEKDETDRKIQFLYASYLMTLTLMYLIPYWLIVG